MIVKGEEIAKIYQLYISDNSRKFNNGVGYLFTNQEIYNEQIQNLDFATTKGFKEEYKRMVKRSLYKQMGARIEFNVTRRMFGNFTEARIKIYNVNKSIRELFGLDLFDFEADTLRREIYLMVGHKSDVGVGSGLGLIFGGTTYTIQNYKQGVDVITEIYARGGEWKINEHQQKFMANMFEFSSKGFKDFLTRLTDELQKTDGINANWQLPIKEGNITKTMYEWLPDNKFNSNVIVESNNIFGIIKKYTPNGYIPFIDNKQFYFLKSPQIIVNEVFNTIANSDVMLETPRRYNNNFRVKTLLLPFVQIGQMLELSSQITSKYNGVPMKVISITHSGTINDAGESKASTELELLGGDSIDYKTPEVKALEEKERKKQQALQAKSDFGMIA